MQDTRSYSSSTLCLACDDDVDTCRGMRSSGLLLHTRLSFNSSPCAKVCNAYSYDNAQSSQELDHIHLDAELSGRSLDVTLICKLLCLFVASIDTFEGERSVGGQELQTLAHGEATSEKKKEIFKECIRGRECIGRYVELLLSGSMSMQVC